MGNLSQSKYIKMDVETFPDLMDKIKNYKLKDKRYERIKKEIEKNGFFDDPETGENINWQNIYTLKGDFEYLK